MFDKNVLLNHIKNNSNHNAMTQAGMKTGFGTQKPQQQTDKPDEKEEYEVIKEAYYGQ